MAFPPFGRIARRPFRSAMLDRAAPAALNLATPLMNKPNKLALLLSAIALAGLFLAPRLPADTITLTADAYMPYTGDSSKGELGFMIELAKAIWEKKGYTVTYQSMGWKEAVTQTRSGSFTAIVGANRDDVPDFLFPDVEEAALQGVFYKAPASDWAYASPDSLTKVCVGAIYDYKYSPEIAAYLTKNTANPKKVFWPTSGLTKGDLLRYYVRVSPWLLPVIADRPLVMKRYPNGVLGRAFYQQRAPDTVPAGVNVQVVDGA